MFSRLKSRVISAYMLCIILRHACLTFIIKWNPDDMQANISPVQLSQNEFLNSEWSRSNGRQCYMIPDSPGAV